MVVKNEDFTYWKKQMNEWLNDLLNEQIPMDVAQYTRGEFLSYLIVWRLTC